MDDQTEKKHIDPLLGCLVALTHLFERPISAESLSADLPLMDHKLAPSIFYRAAERANLKANIVKVNKLREISELVLPAVVLLENDRALVLLSIKDNRAEVILPEVDHSRVDIPLEQLESQYTGYCIYVKPKLEYNKHTQQYLRKKPKSWFWDTVLNYKHNYFQILIATLIVNLFALTSPLFVMNVYDRVVPNNAIETLWAFSFGIFFVYLFDLLLKELRSYLVDISGKKSDLILSSHIFQQVMGLRMACKPQSIGSFINQLGGYEALRDFFTNATITVLVDLPFVFIFLGVMYYIAGKIIIIPLIAIPIILVMAFLLEAPMRKANESAYFRSMQKHAMLVESISQLELVKTTNSQGHLQRRWEQFTSTIAKQQLHARRFSSLIVNGTTYCIQMVGVGIVIYGVYLIQDEQLSMGGLIACSILSNRVLAPLAQVTNIISRFQQSKLGLEALNQIMNMPVEREVGRSYLNREGLQGDIQFRQVSFNYPNQKNSVLHSVNLQITPGEKVAILGRMGSGKSTLHKLILGLYPPCEGQITLDSTDIHQLDPTHLRRIISYVAQEPSLFYGTVRENITVASPWADDQALIQAAQISGVESFVKTHPAGYDMPTGERGECISGGQRQAIAIARALIQNSKILLMDEPTSAMDSSSEKAFIEALQAYYQDKTLLLITHKQSMLQLVDRIIILDQGRIVADGEKQKVLSALTQNKIQVKRD